MGAHILPACPTVPVELDGRTYEMRVGCMGLMPAVEAYRARAASLAAEQDAAGVLAGLEELGELAMRAASLAFGRDAAAELLGDGASLDAARASALLAAVVEESASPEASEALRLAVLGARTADE